MLRLDDRSELTGALQSTINRDGSPEVTVVWVGIENNEFVMGHLGLWMKVQNIRRDPRVALSMLGPNTNAQGLKESLVVYGSAPASLEEERPSSSSDWRTFTWVQTASFLRLDCK